MAEEEGANPEQIFTEFALNMLADAGETENFRVCYDEKINLRFDVGFSRYGIHPYFQLSEAF